MADIDIRQNHQLDQAEARRRLEGWADELTRKLHVNCRWQGETLSFKRPGAEGSIDLSPGLVAVRVKLGMLVRPMKDKIEAQIREQLQTSLT